MLMEHFPKVLDVEFTAKMEDELDGIEEGEIDWQVLLKSFYSPFMHTVDKAKIAMKDAPRRDFSKWIRLLEHVEALTVKMYQDYIRYRDEILTKA